MTGWLDRARQLAWDALVALGDPARWGPLLRAALLLAAGVVLARTVGRLARRVAPRSGGQARVLLQRAATWTVLGVFAVSALRELGFDFTVVLGAAGILTAAAAFASQTSASNIISGVFLGMEGTVQIGDVITVNGVTGEVLSIDLLSTRLRTFDNLMVRIPNETMVKADITNLARFPIRRYDMRVGVAYDSDLALVRATLMEVADRDPLVLEEPAPLIIAQGYGPSSIDLQFSVWARREAYLDVRNGVQQKVKEAFDRAGIEIPFPHVALRTSPARADAGSPDAAPVAEEDDPESSPEASEEGGASGDPRG